MTLTLKINYSVGDNDYSLTYDFIGGESLQYVKNKKTHMFIVRSNNAYKLVEVSNVRKLKYHYIINPKGLLE